MASLKKESIKDRMQKTAARLWGIPDNEIETNFDPLVLLLIEACAAEFEKIGNAINTSQDRLIEKLADLIVPESVIGPKPASAIASAMPLEPIAEFTSQTAFSIPQSYINEVTNTRVTQQVYFTPIGNFRLLKAKLAYAFIGQKFYKLNGNAPKELVYNGSGNTTQNMVNEIWLAISPDKNLTSLDGLSICFDLRSHSMASFLYHSLAQTTAWIDGKEIKLKKGYQNQVQFDLNPEIMLSAGHDYANKINRQIAAIYQQQFIHITENIPATATKLPEVIQNVLPAALVQKVVAEPLVFVKIVLGRYFSQEDLDGLSVHINAFPIINRKFHSQFYRTDPWINIIPINVEGSFLDMHSIQSANGGKYKFRISADQQTLEEGEALIRSGGVGKTNSREVRDIIANLMEAIRDESAYFSETSNDFIATRLKEISQILSRLDDQMQKSKDRQAVRQYILLKPKNAGETVTLQYWSTTGTLANQINAGNVLTSQNHTLTGNRDAYLIGTTTGGRNRTSDSEKKALLKQQIISNGKIISAYDIKMLCFQLFGNNLQQVSVEKGTTVGNGRSQGFSRVINVRLQLLDKNAPDVTYLCRELETTLANEASFIYPFEVMVA